VPTVADRIAQTVVAMELEKRVEPKFHPDSYGYRPRRSALVSRDSISFTLLRISCLMIVWSWKRMTGKSCER